MASFFQSMTQNSPTDEVVQKYSIRRLEPSIQKFLKVIEIDLSRLERHRTNFEKFDRLQDWDGLNREVINASRTLQQIKANLREIEKSREQVIDDDLCCFDNKIDDVKQHALMSVTDFLEVYTHIEVIKLTNYEGSHADDTSIPGYLDPHEDSEINSLVLSDCDDLILSDERLQLHAVPEDTEVSESLENLKLGLLELNDLIHTFASSVHSQQQSVDRIDNNIDRAQNDVGEGVMNIGAVAKLKKVMFPVAGAVMGGILGGPVGLVAGLKLGAMAAVGGSLVGFAGGSLIKKHQNNKIDLEMKDMSRVKSKPLID